MIRLYTYKLLQIKIVEIRFYPCKLDTQGLTEKRIGNFKIIAVNSLY